VDIEVSEEYILPILRIETGLYHILIQPTLAINIRSNFKQDT